MTEIRVDTSAGIMAAFGQEFPCVIGKGGALPAALKREGDGATPLGCWPLRAALVRPRSGFEPPRGLPWRWLRKQDGWSDDPSDPCYNQAVAHPHPFSAERLWRDDGVYDVTILLGHNDRPAQPGMGSAIFWHLANPDRRPTEGCIAIDRKAMATLLPMLTPTVVVWIA